jgi:glycosyltransferase involved in cell wall biosynthesis
MNGSPKISVITPCYNHGKYIGEMLESLFQQTFQAFEIVIVNDGSTDGTKEILNKIRHPAVRVIHTENHGPSHARNVAIEHAVAPIIFNLDADDRIAPSLLARAYDVIQSSPDFAIIYFDVVFFGAKTGRFELLEYAKGNMLLDNQIDSKAFFQKKDWLRVGGYCDKLVYGAEDWDFWLSIIELGGEVIKIPEPLVFYRTYDNPKECRSGLLKSNRIKMATTKLQVFHRHENLYSSCPEAWEYFIRLEKKFQNEGPINRQLRNCYYKLLKHLTR